jgi:hypothetical protein
MDKVALMLVAGRRRYARAAKNFPLAHALFALGMFVAVCGQVLAEHQILSSVLLDKSTWGQAASFFWNAVAQRPPAILRSCSSPGTVIRPIHGSSANLSNHGWEVASGPLGRRVHPLALRGSDWFAKAPKKMAMQGDETITQSR